RPGRIQERNARNQIRTLPPLHRRRRRHVPHYPRREGERFFVWARFGGAGDGAGGERRAITCTLPSLGSRNVHFRRNDEMIDSTEFLTRFASGFADSSASTKQDTTKQWPPIPTYQ